jgi:hypothetical protein
MKVCSGCGRTETESSIWYFCQKCQLFLCYFCAISNFCCPHCKSSHYLIKVAP